MLDIQKRSRIAVILVVMLMLAGGAAKFYHYNYVQHTPGQARTLKDFGLKELVCRNVPYVSNQADQCGQRSIYGDADWGVTAYITIYGVESPDEAQAIAKFMVEARKRNGQEHIPINLQVYSTPRSAGAHPSQHRIFDKNL